MQLHIAMETGVGAAASPPPQTPHSFQKGGEGGGCSRPGEPPQPPPPTKILLESRVEIKAGFQLVGVFLLEGFSRVFAKEETRISGSGCFSFWEGEGGGDIIGNNGLHPS